MCAVVIFAFIHRTLKCKRLHIYSKMFKLLPISQNYWYIYTTKFVSRSFCATIPQRITVFIFQKVNFTLLYHRLKLHLSSVQLSKQLVTNYPLNAELNPVCHLLALLGSHHILQVFRIRVKLRLFSKSQKKNI